MKNLHRLCGAVVFTLVLTIPAFAGDIQTTVTSPPSQPAQTATLSGDIQTGITGQAETGSSEATAANSAAEIALNLLQSVLVRGRASSFGARISSMVLFITLTHRTNHLLDERDLILCKSVLLVELLVRPFAIHRQPWNECKALAVQVLGVCSQRDKESHKLRA